MTKKKRKTIHQQQNKQIKHDIIIISRSKKLNSSTNTFTVEKGDNMPIKKDIILNNLNFSSIDLQSKLDQPVSIQKIQIFLQVYHQIKELRSQKTDLKVTNKTQQQYIYQLPIIPTSNESYYSKFNNLEENNEDSLENGSIQKNQKDDSSEQSEGDLTQPPEAGTLKDIDEFIKSNNDELVIKLINMCIEERVHGRISDLIFQYIKRFLATKEHFQQYILLLDKLQVEILRDSLILISQISEVLKLRC